MERISEKDRVGVSSDGKAWLGQKNGSMSIYGSVKIKKEYCETNLRSDLETFIDENIFKSRRENGEKVFHIIKMEPEALIY
jgi:hypothetical protein